MLQCTVQYHADEVSIEQWRWHERWKRPGPIFEKARSSSFQV